MSINPAELEKIGRALYGNSWRTSMAEALDVDYRRIKHWMDGTRPPPTGVKGELVELMRKNIDELNSVISELVD